MTAIELTVKNHSVTISLDFVGSSVAGENEEYSWMEKFWETNKLDNELSYKMHLKK